MHTDFSLDEWQRYQRQIQLADIGVQGQKALKQARVAIVGVGGLGCPVSMYLAAAGVGEIVLIDHDIVSETNLQRQLLYRDKDVGCSKVNVASAVLRDLNPHITIRAMNKAFSSQLPLADLDVDLILDCTDNYSTRSDINTWARNHKRDWLFASVHQFSGQLCLFRYQDACYHCLFPLAPSEAMDCNGAGVIGSVPGAVGLLQAQQAIQYLIGSAVACDNTLVSVNLQTLTTQKMRLRRDPHCGLHDAKIEPAKPIAPCDSEEVADSSLSPPIFMHKLLNEENIVLVDARSRSEHQAFHIGGRVIEEDEVHVKQLHRTPDTQFFVYCQSGQRSERMVSALKARGFSQVYQLSGGLAAILPILAEDSLRELRAKFS
ncbi:HesA/MoeB/ThiF family protein [Aestuariibacter sp. AA17]|uniref:HesA/MoeB/ThiF family protein n=1 Tax=Fluctibacter corallii TaxID=2984329 RepID=A0ABT3AC27_9ALTE|nr:HesA/MoeB/ThiF family protein [Aestuariibacter sp. AA17]MCV2886227.1 HesA/MoeB/ThiF family protein [Aestuariibacter sp. AA17]